MFLQNRLLQASLPLYRDKTAISAIVPCDRTSPTLLLLPVRRSFLHVPLYYPFPGHDEANSPAMPIEEYLFAQAKYLNTEDRIALYRRCTQQCSLPFQDARMAR